VLDPEDGRELKTSMLTGLHLPDGYSTQTKSESGSNGSTSFAGWVSIAALALRRSRKES
jgi:hypothetical protein